MAKLIEPIAAALDRYRAGEIDVYAFDETIHHYHRATRELWKFCWSGGGGTHTELVAAYWCWRSRAALPKATRRAQS